jgi:hypothetical protein
MLDLTNRERSRLLQYGQQILSPVFSQLHVLNERCEQQKKALQAKAEHSKQLRQKLDAIQIITDES